MAVGSASGLRRRNRDVVLRTIALDGPVSRSQIARQTGLTGAAISRITRELIEVGLVEEGAAIALKGQVGRRNICLELGDNGAFVLGIALTANVRSVSIGNCRGEVIAARRVRGVDMENPEIAVQQLSEAGLELIANTDFDRSRLIGCGVSVAGVIDPESGDMDWSHHLGWEGRPLGREFAERLGLPVRVEARAIALLMAELWGGAAAGLENVILVSNGIWIGGAIMLDGNILRGQNNMVGQIPHMRVGGSENSCTCGRKGCLNAVASGTTVLEELEHIRLPEKKRTTEPGDRLQALAELRGSEFAAVEEVFRSAGQHMGHAVDSFIEMLDPELVLLAGAASRHPGYLQGVRETLGRLRPGEDDWPVSVSNVTSDQSAIWLALEAFVYSRDLDIELLKVA